VSDIAQHLAVSKKVEIEDLDWALARQVGLTQNEVKWLKHFVDVESQTVHYFLEVAKLQVSRDPEILTFLTMWNYEEYFHAYAVTRLLRECGVDVESATERAQKVRSSARVKAKVEDAVQQGMARLLPQSFTALWMTWGALQECLVAQAYESVGELTKNPVLAELFRRIAKQERRHFAYYYHQAKERLGQSTFTQKYVRFIVQKFFSPVGSGVKSDEDIADFMRTLLPGEELHSAMAYTDRKIGALPGMTGFSACRDYGNRIAPLPASRPAVATAHAAA
jgi:rubrerythrin